MKKITFETFQFKAVHTLYGFAATYAKNHGIKSSLREAKVSQYMDYITLDFETEAHRLDMIDISLELSNENVLIGKDEDGQFVIAEAF